MIKGTTASGFEFKIDEESLDDMEFLDALAETEDDPLQFSKVCKMMFGNEQKKKLYDHVRNKDGKVPIEKVSKMVLEIMSYSEGDIKNS